MKSIKQKHAARHRALLSRCLNKYHADFRHYGGRGITVSADWQGKDGFMHFCHDMVPGYRDGLTLDRINNDGPYSKENCRWITQAEQNRNRTLKRAHRMWG